MEAAVQLAEAGRWDEAAAAFRTFIAQAGDVQKAADAYEMLAQVLMEAEAWTDACDAATQAVKLRPDWVEARVTQGRAQRNAGSLAEALDSFYHAQRLLGDPASPEAQALQAELAEVSALYSQDISRQLSLPISIHTAPGSGMGPGCVVWECGLLLARWLVDTWGHTQGRMQGVRLLELGSGTGVVGLSAALLGAQVLTTDQAHVLPLLKDNIARNTQALAAVGGQAHCAALDWDTPGTSDSVHLVLSFLQRDGCRCIVGADLVYTTAQVAKLRCALSWVVEACEGPPHTSEGQDRSAARLHDAANGSLGPTTATQVTQAPLSNPPCCATHAPCQHTDPLTLQVKELIDRTKALEGARKHHVCFLMAHKHRSEETDCALWDMLIELGFVPVIREGSLAVEACGPGSGEGVVTTDAVRWPRDAMLAKSDACGLYCFVR